MISDQDSKTIDAIVRILKKSRSILFITGAGVSADSGLPTYRGIGGLYDVDTTEEGYAIEEVLSAEMFARQPELTWKYLAEIGLAAQGAITQSGSRSHRRNGAALFTCLDADAKRRWVSWHGRLHQRRRGAWKHESIQMHPLRLPNHRRRLRRT